MNKSKSVIIAIIGAISLFINFLLLLFNWYVNIYPDEARKKFGDKFMSWFASLPLPIIIVGLVAIFIVCLLFSLWVNGVFNKKLSKVIVQNSGMKFETKQGAPKLCGVIFYPRWKYRKLIVKNGSLEQVITCLKNGIGTAFWNWHNNTVWYEVDATRTEFYDPKTHDVTVHGFVVHGKKNDIVIKEGGIINIIIGSEEKIENMFTLTIEPAGFKQKVKIHIRLNSDYDYAVPFFDDTQKALENKFGKQNVVLQS